MSAKPRVFISYSRKDGEVFAKELRQRLEDEGIPLWQDRVGMEGGRDWWQQIVDALDTVEFMALVMTPAALSSPIIRKEWRYARQKGVCVYPVKCVPDSELDYHSLPRWMRSAHFYDLEIEWKKFVNDLNTRCQEPRVPFMVEDLPIDFILRPEEFNCLIDRLLDKKAEEPIAITAALRGAGGYGKTTLAKAICHDERTQNTFDDGILWVTLGESPGDLTAKLNNLSEILSGKRPGFTDEQTAATKLAELLADRDILIVLDDVWNNAHVRPFLHGGECCARLITTRNSDTLPPKTRQINVDAMKHEEALRLVGFDLPDTETEKLRELAERLGDWPLLLKLANAFLRARVNNRGQPLSDAIAYVNKALDRRGLTVFDAHNPVDRNQAVSKTLEVSLEMLSDEERARFGELSIFPEDVDIPFETVAMLWRHAGYDGFDTEALCERLWQLSLLLNFDLTNRHIRLHDVLRGFLRTQHSEQLQSTHVQFLSTYDHANWSDLPATEPYMWQYLAYHLHESQQISTLRKLLLDFSWLKNKLAVCDVNALVKDYDFLPEFHEIMLVQKALRLSSNQLESEPNQLTGHLLGRLMDEKYPEIQALLAKAIHNKKGPWLRPLTSTLMRPGGPLLRTLEGHSNTVFSVAISLDGKTAVSASRDNTLKIWDLVSGSLLHTMDCNSETVNAVAFSPDGNKVVSASNDGILKVWNIQTSKPTHILRGHSERINGVAISPDGKTAVSASEDKTLKIWDLETGQTVRTLHGHSGPVRAFVISPDGKTAVSASMDCTLKIWDLETGQSVRTLHCHSGPVEALVISPDGKTAVSASWDKTFKFWDLETGEIIESINSPHSWGFKAPAISPDGKIAVSASDDMTLKVWNLKSAKFISTLQGHCHDILAVAISPDGKTAVSASDDMTLKVWNLKSAKHTRTMRCHSGGVWAVAISPDGKTAVSASEDKTLIIWDLKTFKPLQTLLGHSDRVTSVAISPDGKMVLSASSDNRFKVWDLKTGELTRSLDSHSNWVNAVAINPDGKTAVSSSDNKKALKIWDLKTGKLIHTLRGHSKGINGVAISPNGKTVLSASSDKTLKVWDLLLAKPIWTLKSHNRPVWSVAISHDGKTAVSASDDLKVWDLSTRECTRTMKGHRDWIWKVAVSPDGKIAFSASEDNVLKVWDLDSGEEITSFIGDGNMYTCAIALDGKTLVAGEASGLVHFLRLEGYEQPINRC